MNVLVDPPESERRSSWAQLDEFKTNRTREKKKTAHNSLVFNFMGITVISV
ncbi:MAG: hypothetical protein ABSH17_12150 [Syntrophobacteraceae bacterium]|jgi:hypothetical protein